MASNANTATFSVELEDDTSGAAESAASSLEKLKTKINEDVAALKSMQQAMRNLQGGASVNIESFRALKDAIAAKKESVAANQQKFLELGGTFRALKPSAKGAESGFKDLLEAVKAGAGPLGGFIGQAKDVSKALGTLGLAGAAVIAVAAVAALTAALVAGFVALAKFALVSSDAARSQAILIEGLTGSKEGAAELQGAIDEVSASVAIGSDEVGKLAKDLYASGLRGAELKTALQGAALAASGLGKEGGAKAMALAARQLLALDVQAKKLKEHTANLFAGVNIEPFLRALKDVLSVFDETTSTGRALKILVTGIFDPIFAATEKYGPVVKAFFQGMVIGALLFGIAVLKIRNFFRETFGSETKEGIDLITLATNAGVIVMGALVGALSGLALALGLVAGIAYAVIYPFVAFFELLGNLWDFASSIDWSALGTSIVDGIIEGIQGGISKVGGAIVNLGKSAVASLESALGIGSPSKVFALQGMASAEGYAQGVEQGGPTVDAAVGDMVGIPAASSPTGGAVANDNSGNRGPISITIYAPDGDAKTIGDEVRKVLADILEGEAIQMASPLEAGGSP